VIITHNADIAAWPTAFAPATEIVSENATRENAAKDISW
jgi:hypothetical protein